MAEEKKKVWKIGKELFKKEERRENTGNIDDLLKRKREAIEKAEEGIWQGKKLAAREGEKIQTDARIETQGGTEEEKGREEGWWMEMKDEWRNEMKEWFREMKEMMKEEWKENIKELKWEMEKLVDGEQKNEVREKI